MDGSRKSEPAAAHSQAVLETARNLSVDRLAAEVARGLAARGARSILLKGASFAAWLYRDGSVRPYGDVDLLIAQGDVATARAVIVDMGFRPLYDSLPYFVRDNDAIDVHTSIKGCRADDDVVWEVLSGATERQEIGGLELEVLAPGARALHVALHAAQHGRDWPTQMEDLRRALEILPFETWASASRLAGRLSATDALGTGLRLLPAGALVADRLGLEPEASAEAVLRSKSGPALALGFAELHATRGVSAKLRFVARKLFPSRSYMRAMVPVARRGALGLFLAYMWRLGWLLSRAGPGFRAWRQSRREVDRAS